MKLGIKKILLIIVIAVFAIVSYCMFWTACGYAGLFILDRLSTATYGDVEVRGMRNEMLYHLKNTGIYILDYPSKTDEVKVNDDVTPKQICSDDFSHFYYTDTLLAVYSEDSKVYLIDIQEEKLLKKYDSNSEFESQYDLKQFEKMDM